MSQGPKIVKLQLGGENTAQEAMFLSNIGEKQQFLAQNIIIQIFLVGISMKDIFVGVSKD